LLDEARMTAEPSSDVELMRAHIRRVARRSRAALYAAFTLPYALGYAVNLAADPRHHSMKAMLLAGILWGVGAVVGAGAIRLATRASNAKLSAAAAGTDDEVTATYRKLLDDDIVRARVVVVGLPLFGLLFYASYIYDQRLPIVLAYPLVAVVATGLVLGIARLHRLTGKRARMFR
jgi:hypothetical protein